MSAHARRALVFVVLLTFCAVLIGMRSKETGSISHAFLSAVAGYLFTHNAARRAGFGVYVGRFLRWNSWDAVTNPQRLFADIVSRVINPLSHPRTVGMTAIYGTGLLLGYIALRVIGSTTERRSTARTA